MNIYNKFFNTNENSQIASLISRTTDTRKPRVNRKGGESKLDPYFLYIKKCIADGKSYNQIKFLIKHHFKFEISKSALCRFIRKRNIKNV